MGKCSPFYPLGFITRPYKLTENEHQGREISYPFVRFKFILPCLALIDIFSVGGHFDRNNIITFGLASTIISLLGLCIGYLTLRAMK
jgi:hypothetical protein